MLRSELARRTGVSVDTLRFYEREGVIPVPPRLANGYRDYDDGYVPLLQFVVETKQLGMPLSGIRDLVAALRNEELSADELRQLIRERIELTEREQRRLAEEKRALEFLLTVPDTVAADFLNGFRAAATPDPRASGPESARGGATG
ncbi:MAG: MerR family transcriptional regulator [Mycetocola sp.]